MTNRVLIERLLGRVSVLEMEVEELKERAGEGDSVCPGVSVVIDDDKLCRRKKERVWGEWVPLSEVDMKSRDKRIALPLAIKFPDGTERELKGGWNGLKDVMGEYFDVDERTRVRLGIWSLRQNAMEEVIRLAGAQANEFAIAFSFLE